MSISIQIWSDIACPWCFVGKQRLHAALAAFTWQPNAVAVNVQWRAFELDPHPKVKSDLPYVERLAKKYGRTTTQAQQMIDTMSSAIVEAGGEADFNRLVPANTFDTHRLIQWAGSLDCADKQAQHKLTDAIMRAYLGQGLDVSNKDVLVELALSVGLDAQMATQVLSSDQYVAAVREDEKMAQRYGISGVPFFAIGRYGISGAQDAETLLKVLNDVLQENATVLADGSQAENKLCGQDGCDLPEA